MSEPKPIATAPKDGTPFLAWSKAYGWIVCNQPPGCALGQWSVSPKTRNWVGSADRRTAEATHWTAPPPEPTP